VDSIRTAVASDDKARFAALMEQGLAYTRGRRPISDRRA
jgi:hypothetical protein